MCSIFGYVARGKSTVSIQALESIVRGNINRGPHAFGFAWIDQRGRLHCFKQYGRLTDSLGVLMMARGAKMLVGHLRFATHGDPQANINNHPHPVDGGWLVHNGVVGNYARLVRENEFSPVSECDSEALGLLVEQSQAPSLLERCAGAVEASTGALGLLGLWARPATMVVARRGNPLHVSDGVDGVYLASLARGLPGKVLAIADDSVRTFRFDAGTIRCRRLDLESESAASNLWQSTGEYAGG